MLEEKYLETIEEMRAFSDPYRLDILRTFYTLGRPATVKQIADTMNEVPAKIHYHVKKLVKTNILELDHTEEIKGIIAKFYYPTAKSFSIKKNDKLNDEIFLNEASVTCSKIIDEFKKTFVSSVKDNRGTLSAEHIYLTEDEYQEVLKTISTIFEKYKSKEKCEERKNHYFFTGIIGVEGKPKKQEDQCATKES